MSKRKLLNEKREALLLALAITATNTQTVNAAIFDKNSSNPVIGFLGQIEAGEDALTKKGEEIIYGVTDGIKDGSIDPKQIAGSIFDTTLNGVMNANGFNGNSLNVVYMLPTSENELPKVVVVDKNIYYQKDNYVDEFGNTVPKDSKARVGKITKTIYPCIDSEGKVGSFTKTSTINYRDYVTTSNTEQSKSITVYFLTEHGEETEYVIVPFNDAIPESLSDLGNEKSLFGQTYKTYSLDEIATILDYLVQEYKAILDDNQQLKLTPNN